jgi:hypothetical protein
MTWKELAKSISGFWLLGGSLREPQAPGVHIPAAHAAGYCISPLPGLKQK